MVFPPAIAHVPALIHVMTELIQEVRCQVPRPVQNACMQAFSPWGVAYEKRYMALIGRLLQLLRPRLHAENVYLFQHSSRDAYIVLDFSLHRIALRARGIATTQQLCAALQRLPRNASASGRRRNHGCPPHPHGATTRMTTTPWLAPATKCDMALVPAARTDETALLLRLSVQLFDSIRAVQAMPDALATIDETGAAADPDSADHHHLLRGCDTAWFRTHCPEQMTIVDHVVDWTRSLPAESDAAATVLDQV